MEEKKLRRDVETARERLDTANRAGLAFARSIADFVGAFCIGQAQAPHHVHRQLDEAAYPILMAFQLGMTDATLYANHIRPAANFLIAHGHYKQARALLEARAGTGSRDPGALVPLAMMPGWLQQVAAAMPFA